MRDAQIMALINESAGRIMQALSKPLNNMAKELDDLRSYMTAETIRRQTLEEMLFEKSSLLGGLDKDAYEARYTKNIEGYKKEVEEKMEQIKEEVAEKAKGSSKTIYTPDGGKVEVNAPEPSSEVKE